MRSIVPSVTDRDSDVATILRAVLRLSRRLRGEAQSGGLSGGALSILGTLHRAGPLPAVALAAEEGLAPQSLTRLLRLLEEMGLIARTTDAEDRRAKVITITAQGRLELRAGMRERRKWLAGTMDERLDENERAQLVDAAELILRLTL